MKNLSSLLEKGNFYPVAIDSQILGKEIDKISDDDLRNWNSVKLNVTLNLRKLPGHEAPEKKASLVESEIMQDTNAEMQKGINEFLVSRINGIFKEMTDNSKDDKEKENFQKIQDQLQNKLIKDEELV